MAKFKVTGELDQEMLAKAKKDERNFSRLQYSLKMLGIPVPDDGKVPESGGVPRIFIYDEKNEVARTLKEADIGGLKSPAFLEALLKGQVFAYPSGKSAPVQMQANFATQLNIKTGEPIDMNVDDPRNGPLPEPPATKPAPKWYHKLLSFIPSNRKVINDYKQYQQDYANWEKECDTQKKKYDEEYRNGNWREIDTVNAVKEKFGAERSAQSLKDDKVMQEQVDRELAKAELDSLKKDHLNRTEDGIDIMVNVYGTHPEVREEWLKKTPEEDTGLYTREQFEKLTSVSLDPGKVRIGEKGLTEREFATLAMFAATNVETSLEQQKVSVSDPADAIETFQKAGYTEAQAERLVADANNSGFTIDILHRENRMAKYFEPAVNAGRDIAAKALAVYPLKKEPLAEILSRAVEQSGIYVGVNSDKGVTALTKLGGEMLKLMERDPELKQLAKASFEQREKEFCTGTRIPDKKFDDLVDSIQKAQKFNEIQQKGYESRAAIFQARAEGKQMTPEQKKGHIRNILAANMTEALRNNQVEKAEKEAASPDDRQFNYASMVNESMRLMTMNTGALIGATGNGSSMASSAPMMLPAALSARVTKKPGVLTMVNDEKQMQTMMQTMDKIIEKDHLGDKSLDELIKDVASKSSDVYERDKIMGKAVDVEGVSPERLAEKAAQRERAAERQNEQPVRNQEGISART